MPSHHEPPRATTSHHGPPTLRWGDRPVSGSPVGVRSAGQAEEHRTSPLEKGLDKSFLEYEYVRSADWIAGRQSECVRQLLLAPGWLLLNLRREGAA